MSEWKARSRKSLPKTTREAVFNKFGGKCSYCGIKLDIKSFQIDHLHPFFLAHHEPDLNPDRIENLMPACAKCNKFKHSFRLEDYRRELGLQASRLKKNAQFNRALTFGQVIITESPIVFYFESLPEPPTKDT